MVGHLPPQQQPQRPPQQGEEHHPADGQEGPLKQFRRIATRYEKLDRNFLAMISLVSAMIWLA